MTLPRLAHPDSHEYLVYPEVLLYVEDSKLAHITAGTDTLIAECGITCTGYLEQWPVTVQVCALCRRLAS